MPDVAEVPVNFANSMPQVVISPPVSVVAASLPQSEEQKEKTLPKNPFSQRPKSTINEVKNCGDGCGGCSKAATCKVNQGAQGLSSKEREALVQLNKQATDKPAAGFVPPTDEKFKPSKAALKFEQKIGAETTLEGETRLEHQQPKISNTTAPVTPVTQPLKVEPLPIPKTTAPVNVADNKVVNTSAAKNADPVSSRPIESRAETPKTVQPRVEVQRAETTRAESPRVTSQEVKTSQVAKPTETARPAAEVTRSQPQPGPATVSITKPDNSIPLAAKAQMFTQSPSVVASPPQVAVQSRVERSVTANSLSASPSSEPASLNRKPSNEVVVNRSESLANRSQSQVTSTSISSQTASQVNNFSATSANRSTSSTSSQLSSKVEISRAPVLQERFIQNRNVPQAQNSSPSNMAERSKVLSDQSQYTSIIMRKAAEQTSVVKQVVQKYSTSEISPSTSVRHLLDTQGARSQKETNRVVERGLVARPVQDVTRTTQTPVRSEQSSAALYNRFSSEAQLRRTQTTGSVIGRETAMRQLNELGRGLTANQGRLSAQSLERIRDLSARIRQAEPRNLEAIKLDRIASNLLLVRQVSRLEQVAANSKMPANISERLVNRQLQDMLRSLSRTTANSLSPEAANKLRQVLERLTRAGAKEPGQISRDQKQIDMIARQLRVLLNQKVRSPDEATTVSNRQDSRIEVMKMAKLDVSEQNLLKRISQLQEKIGNSKELEKQIGEKVVARDGVEVKEKSLKEQLANLQNRLSDIRQLRSNLVARMEKNSTQTNNQPENKKQQQISPAVAALRNEILAIMRTGQINSPATLQLLASKLSELLRVANQNNPENSAELQRMKNLEAMQQMLREGQELSAAMLKELFELIGENFEDTEEFPLAVRKGRKKAGKGSASVKKEERKGFGLKMEESKVQKNVVENETQKTSGIREVKNAKTGGLITGTSTAPTKQLDVVQSIEKNGKKNSYYEDEEVFEEQRVAELV